MHDAICTMKRRSYVISRFQAISLVWAFLFACNSHVEENPHQEIQHKQEILTVLHSQRLTEDTLQQMIYQSMDEKDEVATMLYLKELGKRKRENSKFSAAIAQHQNALNIAIHLKDTLEIAQIYNNLGTNFRRIGGYAEALDYHYSALHIAEEYSRGDTDDGLKNIIGVAKSFFSAAKIRADFLTCNSAYFVTFALIKKRNVNKSIHFLGQPNTPSTLMA